MRSWTSFASELLRVYYLAEEILLSWPVLAAFMAWVIRPIMKAGLCVSQKAIRFQDKAFCIHWSILFTTEHPLNLQEEPSVLKEILWILICLMWITVTALLFLEMK